jgi:retron-type reverse transcriptase
MFTGESMVEWNALISKKNLHLAWNRIATGRNLQHKRFFRHIYGGYELGLNENITLLHEKLKGDWEPTPPTRIYLPKSSGMLRPITLLVIEDQIVLQAIANKVATHVATRRRKVEQKQVFSNCLERRDGTIFFLQDWRTTYSAFQKQLEKHLKGGYTWIAHFDLAAFYETISHKALQTIIAPRGGNHETWDKVHEWLSVWSTGKSGIQTEHGLPQGPLASDFLAETFLLPLDESMKRRNVKYIRYVDDIRVLAKTEEEARRGAIELELECRKWSLIPQGAKFKVIQAKTLQEALGSLPSIVESATPGADEPELSKADARKIMRDALQGRPLRVADKTRLRYVLYRAAPDYQLLKWTLDLLPRNAVHIDAFISYLSQYGQSKVIMDRIVPMLKKGVLYEYVEGELWQLAARLGQPKEINGLLSTFKKRCKAKNKTMALEWGLLIFAAASVRAGAYQETTAIRQILSCDPYVQSLVALCCAQHKRTYVAPEVMLRWLGTDAYLLDGPHFVRNITFSGYLADQLHRREIHHCPNRRYHDVPISTATAPRRMP